MNVKNISYYRLVNGEIYNSHVRLLGPGGKLFLRPQLAPDNEVYFEYKEQIQLDIVNKCWTLWSVIFIPLKLFNMSTSFSKIQQKRSLVKIRPLEVALFQAHRQTDRRMGRHVEANRHFSLPTSGKSCIVSTE
jgi:hypothetical protein